MSLNCPALSYHADLKTPGYPVINSEARCPAISRAQLTCFATEITTYLDQPHIRKVLGVDQSIGNYSSCSEKVGRSFGTHLDSLQPTHLYVGALLEREVKIIIYVGTCTSFGILVHERTDNPLILLGVYDWMCNFKGNERWVHALEWTGSDAFNAAKYRKWEVDGKAAGDVKSAKGLTFATVFEAGHMVRDS